MENIIKYMCGGVAALLSFFAPIGDLILCAVAFVAIDMVTGIWASACRAARSGRPWRLESARAWRTVVKLFFVLGGIVMAWLADTYIVAFMELKLANLFTGFVCGVEFWSYLENASDISGHPLFCKIRQWMRRRFGDFFHYCGEKTGQDRPQENVKVNTDENTEDTKGPEEQ